jgi:hypothetical protein
VTTVETTNKPIEVLLSRPHLEITCRIVLPDGTAIAVGVDALSLRGAQHEMTAWLAEQGYEPAGRWSTQDEDERHATLTFRCRDPGPALPGPPPGAAAARPPEHGPDPGPAPRRPPRAVPRIRRAAPSSRPAPVKRNDDDGASSRELAEAELQDCPLASARRDEVIRAAAAAGVRLPRIQEITGVARTTIMRILGSPPLPAARKAR